MAIAMEAGDDPSQVAMPDDIPQEVLSVLHARRMAIDAVPEVSAGERVPDRRTVLVGREITDELSDVNLGTICARLATGLQHCAGCRLPIAEDGPANYESLSLRSMRYGRNCEEAS
ncbi:hypothetical protein ORV05_13950 [Amycolatopsis cynarae]|uniref:Uncharacterized protein n=1 Tax=Amycolatopsis cynarae TaxID=2995223 RepID=A0ABY7BCE6_9PSEU|nr:hypothetical protein [Amycolatopsis sp. HUAS 11-8]WAL68818.1 hypothetical protein ORV05_13950 [Amycolatopsis sp. HUAS 11-8]